jgi:Flp pilus assembly protein TadG
MKSGVAIQSPTGGKALRKGSVMVEFTLSLPLLVALFLGISHFGYAFYMYSELVQAVTAGARYASLQKYDSANATPSTGFRTAVQNVVVFGNPAASGTETPAAPGLTRSNVLFSVTFQSGAPAAVGVSIQNYRLPTAFGSMTLSHKPSAWFPFLGLFAPP